MVLKAPRGSSVNRVFKVLWELQELRAYLEIQDP
jgi:predicted RNA-binding protein with EMAP domain